MPGVGGVTVPVGSGLVTLTFCVATGGASWSGAVGLHDLTSQANYGTADGRSSSGSGTSNVSLPNGEGTGTVDIFESGGNVYCRLSITPSMPWVGSISGVVTLTSATGVETQVGFHTPVSFQ